MIREFTLLASLEHLPTKSRLLKSTLAMCIVLEDPDAEHGSIMSSSTLMRASESTMGKNGRKSGRVRGSGGDRAPDTFRLLEGDTEREAKLEPPTEITEIMVNVCESDTRQN